MEKSRSAGVGGRKLQFSDGNFNGGENGCTEFHFCPENGIFSPKFCMFIRKFTNKKLG